MKDDRERRVQAAREKGRQQLIEEDQLYEAFTCALQSPSSSLTLRRLREQGFTKT